MSEEHAIPDEPSSTEPRWPRPHVAATLASYEASVPGRASQRQFSLEAEVPRTTLQYWIGRKASLDAEPSVIAFFESPVGLAVLHRIVGALHLVFTLVGPCGVDLVSLFLELSHLNRFVGSSHGSQHQVSAQVQKATIAFEQKETARLASAMSPKKITVCEDETFHPEICLVGIEPVSGFILLESYSERRDAATWNEAMENATQGLAVQIVQATGDEASGLRAHARDGLGAHHSPDLFHVSHEVTKGICPALASKTREAAVALQKAEKQTLGAKAERDAFEDPGRKRGPGRRPGFEKRIDEATQQEEATRGALAEAVERQGDVREAINGLSSAYHPFDLATGAARSAAEVARSLEGQFDQIERVITEAGLSERARAHVEKARRVLPAMRETVAFVHCQILAMVAALSLSVEVELVVLELLLPGLYLHRVAAKAPTAERRESVDAVASRLLAQARAPDSPLATLSAAERATVERVALECADLFQRSSSCVEGRNGQLALHHHSLHRLSAKKLQALTVVHNFFIRRADGTTAAERFFGTRPADLFEWILDNITVPVRPAKSRSVSHIRAA